MPRYITIRNDKMRNPQPEWDSDANEDPGRELQLDRSFDAWMADNMEEQRNREEALTQVPEGNAFQAAEQLDEE